jgi:hypothetical protein
LIPREIRAENKTESRGHEGGVNALLLRIAARHGSIGGAAQYEQYAGCGYASHESPDAGADGGVWHGFQSSIFPHEYMVHFDAHRWRFMIRSPFITDIQQTGPRGADKFAALNWMMGEAEHQVGGGRFGRF